ncbi:MAG: mechanosensitive ion channel domain-containing protein [Gammaproteobacteria bacterium]
MPQKTHTANIKLGRTGVPTGLPLPEGYRYNRLQAIMASKPQHRAGRPSVCLRPDAYSNAGNTMPEQSRQLTSGILKAPGVCSITTPVHRIRNNRPRREIGLYFKNQPLKGDRVLFRQFVISIKYIAIFLLIELACPVSQAQDREPPSASAQTSGKSDNEQLLADINERQNALKASVASLSKRLAAAKSADRAQEAELLKANLAVLEQLGTTYDQQEAALERQQSIKASEKLLEEKISKLKAQASADASVSFMDLDRTREELDVELSREKTLASRVELAETALKQAQQRVQQKQDKLSQLKAEASGESNQTEIAVESAQRELEQAEQNTILHEMELQNEKLAKAVHQTRIEFLRRQVDILQAHATFSPDALQEQLNRIDKETFELNRELSRAKEQQITVKNRLDRARKRLATAGVDDQKRIETEVEALRMEFEALKTQIDTTSRRIELLADWKEVWQRRYAVFNQSVEQATLPKWRDEAQKQLEQIDQEEATLKLWLADWQSRLITLDNKIENKRDTFPEDINGLTRQRDYVLAIIDHFQDLKTTFENSRRLHKKLVDEINLRTSQRSWRDWLDLAVHYEIYENTLLDWSYAFTSALVTFVLLYFLRWILIRRLKHLENANKTTLANGFITSVKKANSFFFLMLAVSVASLFLTLDPATVTNITRLTKVAFVFQAAVWGSGFVRIWVFLILARRTKRDGASMGALSIFNFSSQVILWSIALLLILQNLGIDVTALVAGLGIGGVAVALSLQRILNDLFSSLSIVLDKPFVTGDFVIFDDFMGSIEHIGIKTTRIRSLTGEQIICPNGNLLDARIRNYKRMQERRVTFNLGVVYQTPAEKLQHIPDMIREIIEAQDNTRFDRAHFASYSDFALLFEIVYYVLSPDYNLYMDIQQKINLEIFKRFQAADIEFAYPTQSLYVQSVNHYEQATGVSQPAWGQKHG